MPLIKFTNIGLYCPQGDFYIDPWKPVGNAIITHGHSDHATAGSTNYLCHINSLPILKYRLGVGNFQSVYWGETIERNGVKISLHPAGHVIGSSQVRLEYKNEIWVFTGDYKTENDDISGAFEPIKCHHFITESTFGLPIYKWKPQSEIYKSIQNWVQQNVDDGKVPVLIAYSLGKAQRVLSAISQVSNNIYVHGAIHNMQKVLLDAGLHNVEVKRVVPDIPKNDYRNAVIIAPPSADGTPWMKKFAPHKVGVCSGWMQVRGNARRRNADMGFAMSDHADWQGLLDTVAFTGAENIYVTHGYQSVLAKYLTEQGLNAVEVKTQYGNDEEVTEPDGDPPIPENVSLPNAGTL